MKRNSITRSSADRKNRITSRLTGSGSRAGILNQAVLYILLVGIGFVYLLPILKMISMGMMDIFDLTNPLVEWIPTKLSFENFRKGFIALGGFDTLLQTTMVMLVIAVAQTLSSAVIGYGFQRFEFWGKNLLLALVLITFLLPPQVTELPNFVQFANYGWLKSIYPILVPSLTGQGIRHAVFILIFYQFYRLAPISLDEAASIDGASPLKTFLAINLRMATPAIIVVFCFSFVWNWNDTNLTGLYFGDAIRTVPIMLKNFEREFSRNFSTGSGGTNMSNIGSLQTKGIIMAGTLMSILPLITMYFLVERKLIESIDRSGITGE
ncbi:MAG: carbohydrate ABC transporter permease [Saccharofermentanales bacterium]